MGWARILLAAAVATALADGSIVTLALPPLLIELDLTVEGVAAVIGVYTLTLTIALLPAELARRSIGPRLTAAIGLWIFAGASMICAGADTSEGLLFARALQAVGAAGALVGAFELLEGGNPSSGGGKLWAWAAIFGFAAGPALGGALTEAFDWRAIFIVQVPITALAAFAALALRTPESAPVTQADDRNGGSDPGIPAPIPQAPSPSSHQREILAGLPKPFRASRPPSTGGQIEAAISLALLSAALTAVLFGVVLLLISGWAVSPIVAAAAVSALPLTAVPGSRVGGDPRFRAAAGSVLVAGGIGSMAFLPSTSIWWVVPAAALAGAGMGLALPALAGGLLPELTPGHAARGLAIRHAGITIALAILGPVIGNKLDSSIEEVRVLGVAVVLDAELKPDDKFELAPDLISSVDAESPRGALRDAFTAQRDRFEGDDLSAYDALGRRADSIVVAAVRDSFRPAFLITAALALLVILFIRPPPGKRAAWVGVLAGAALLPAIYRAEEQRLLPDPVVIQNPCDDRDLPDVGGIFGLAQKGALELLDIAACRFGSSREELVLALADDAERDRYERIYGVDPRSVPGVVKDLIGID